ncbi:sensor histidine kinase [Streptomyces sp. NPDC000594]|uniref:sensor histidine kinase n=1 Tax=Streptomyces sp. NPDC000594 TaxID=3154261 RepID=UPI00332C163C
MRVPRRLHGSHLFTLDVAAALLIVVVYVGFTRLSGEGTQPVYTGPAWAGVLVAAVVGGPVAVRRLWPVPAAAAALAGAATATLLDVTREPWAGAGLVLYAVALTRPPRRSVPVLAAALVLAAAAVLLGEAVVTPAGTWSGAAGVGAIVWVVLGGGWAAGFAVRARRAREGERALQRTEHAIAEERLRIARELHDIVSHSLSLIVVKAGVAGHVAQRRPEEAADALRVIEQVGRAAMTEMRRTLGALRAESAPLGPAPGLDALDGLADQARQAGVDVDLDIRVPDGALPAGIALAVHRIVQESLTNAVRHAAPARCRVTVESDPHEVRIDITDDGVRGTARERTGGHGLVGMRERALLHGGTFSAGPRPGGGFAVSARLPQDGAKNGAREDGMGRTTV